MWTIKHGDLAMKERLSKMSLLDSLIGKKEPLVEYEEALKKKLINDLIFLLFCFLLLNSSSCSCCVERVHVGKQSRSKDAAVKSGVVVSCHESSVSCHDVAVKSGVVSCFLSCII
ncbi:hypothetical protein F2Q70_00018711 [Brassica cretica]|uniref:Uncharacterized protein n=1 Tax=Brassica cretica TaxID=69181 RepID=A0A8S9HTV5_BRACR|nr:hypothetical protein F2Q70_00018711 [Brassica cretica]KAF2597781.1 hypothetical protein F2Q68_00012299 [Brassica cretica]